MLSIKATRGTWISTLNKSNEISLIRLMSRGQVEILPVHTGGGSHIASNNGALFFLPVREISVEDWWELHVPASSGSDKVLPFRF